MIEEWRDIPGFEGEYQASTMGRIRSLDRIITRGASRRRGEYKTRLPGRILAECDGAQGYQVTNLGKKQYRVHRLVAKTFIQNPYGKKEVNHKDGNKKNNCVDNLEWCTGKENQAHARDVLGVKFGAVRSKPVRCIETGEIFDNSMRAAKEDPSAASRIRLACKNTYGRKTCMGYHWEFV